MKVSNRIAIFSHGHLEQLGPPREIYEQPANEFVARFIGVMNVVELEVRDGRGRVNELEFRPYAVEVSSDPRACRYRAVLRHTFFQGVMLRLELALPSGLTIRARMSKE